MFLNKTKIVPKTNLLIKFNKNDLFSTVFTTHTKFSLRNSVFTGVGSAQDIFVTGIPSSAPQLREKRRQTARQLAKKNKISHFVNRRARGLNIIGLTRNFYRTFVSRAATQRSNPRARRSVRLRSAGPQRRPILRFLKRPAYIENLDRSPSKLYRAFLLQYSFQRFNPRVNSSIRARSASPQRWAISAMFGIELLIRDL